MLWLGLRLKLLGRTYWICLILPESQDYIKKGGGILRTNSFPYLHNLFLIIKTGQSFTVLCTKIRILDAFKKSQFKDLGIKHNDWVLDQQTQGPTFCPNVCVVRKTKSYIPIYRISKNSSLISKPSYFNLFYQHLSYVHICAIGNHTARFWNLLGTLAQPYFLLAYLSPLFKIRWCLSVTLMGTRRRERDCLSRESRSGFAILSFFSQTLFSLL